jgi:hypothetical protein
MNHFDSLFGGGARQDDQRLGSASPVGTRTPVGDVPSKCKEAGGARDSITHDGDDSAQHWRGASVIQASAPAQCREMCQLCDDNMSQAASQWTEASTTGVMMPAREEQRRQCDKGEYACATRKMTSWTLASGAAWDDKDDAECVLLHQEGVVSIGLFNWLCDDNVSPAASQWTEAIASGVMMPAHGEQRRQHNEGEYACARTKMTSSTSGSVQGHLKRQAALSGTTRMTPSVSSSVRGWTPWCTMCTPRALWLRCLHSGRCRACTPPSGVSR